MRFPLLSTAALLLLAACQTGQPDAERNPTVTAADSATADAPEPAVAPAQLARQLSPLVNGVWVKAAFLDGLSRTRSPLAVSGTPAGSGLTALALDLRQRRQDSVAVTAIENNHEGAALLVLLRPGRRAQALPLRYAYYEDDQGTTYELGYSRQAADTVLTLRTYDGTGRLREQTPYRRVRPAKGRPDEVLPRSLKQAVHQAVLAGQYAGTDSAGRPAQARFDADGQVSGLGSFRRYEVNIDFIGPENNVNKLFLDPYTDRQRTLAFRFRGDTLRLYAVQHDAEQINLRPARLHYTLVRRR
jgi:hypothetical protein